MMVKKKIIALRHVESSDRLFGKHDPKGPANLPKFHFNHHGSTI